LREDDFRETARFTPAGEPAREKAAVLQRGFRETVGLDALGSSLAPPESARMEELLKMRESITSWERGRGQGC